MIVEALDKEWNVNDCTYKQRRELHALNAKVWWEGKQDVGAYYELFDKVSEIAGLGENDFEGMEMIDIDVVLQSILFEFLGLSKKATGG